MAVTTNMLRQLADEIEANPELVETIEFVYDNDSANQVTHIRFEMSAKYGEFQEVNHART